MTVAVAGAGGMRDMFGSGWVDKNNVRSSTANRQTDRDRWFTTEYEIRKLPAKFPRFDIYTTNNTKGREDERRSRYR